MVSDKILHNFTFKRRNLKILTNFHYFFVEIQKNNIKCGYIDDLPHHPSLNKLFSQFHLLPSKLGEVATRHLYCEADYIFVPVYLILFNSILNGLWTGLMKYTKQHLNIFFWIVTCFYLNPKTFKVWQDVE